MRVRKLFSWNSAQYEKFIKERTQPSIDLVNKIHITNPQNVIDIGCGPGNSTNVLHEKFMTANITGADSSQEMITSAKDRYSELNFLLLMQIKILKS